MQIRLDSDLPDGISYAPDEMAAHNRKKRLFLPFIPFYDKVSGPSTVSSKNSKQESSNPFVLQEEDEGGENQDEMGDRLSKLELNAKSTNKLGPSDAASYAASIDMTPDRNSSSSTNMTSYGGGDPRQGYDPSISDTHRSTSSRMSTMTASSLYLSGKVDSASRKSRSEDPNRIPKAVLDRVNVTPFRAPPSMSGEEGQQPWSTKERTTHKGLERSNEERRRINEQGGDNGVLLPELDEQAWHRINAEGDVPGLKDLEAKRIEEEGGLSIADDGKSIFTTSTFMNPSNKTINEREERERNPNAPLLVSDIFTSTPFPFPSRLIRRTSPRQCLLLISGICLTSQKAAALAEAQVQAQQLLGLQLSPSEMKAKIVEMREEKATEKSWLSRFGSNDSGSDSRAGLGVYFSPERVEDVEAEKQRLLEIEAGFKEDEGKSKVFNMSRRLERPSGFHKTSGVRATLRAALAALEYVKWEEEGRDQIVIGTDERWLVEGISEE